jgi:two-component system nitrogen regulation response regulator GlnG/two-component system response regulator HydG
VKNYPQAGMDALEGLVARADAGVLFLDEIANLPSDAQGALLRVLDGGHYKPGGAKEFRHVLFRLVAAMNREEEVLQADLRKRLMIKVNVPNLAERRDDIPLILRHLLRKARAALKGDRAEESDLVKHMLVEQTDGSLEVVPPVAFVLELMRRPSFDGNVRDLESAMWDLFFRSAPPQVRAELDKPPRPGAAANEDERSLQLTAAEVQWCLRKTGGNVSAAAKLAGMSRPAFYRALERVGMKGERGRRG